MQTNLLGPLLTLSTNSCCPETALPQEGVPTWCELDQYVQCAAPHAELGGVWSAITAETVLSVSAFLMQTDTV